MRLIKNQIDAKHCSGSATLLPEEPEDMWHAYNLIRPSDLLRASAIRRVTTTSDTGSSTSQRVHMTLTLRVTSTDFDPQASQLHVSGKVAEANAHVAQGQYHTLDLELHRNFTLEKADGWDSVAIQILKEAVDAGERASVWAIVMQEGMANICLITEFQTILRQTVQTSVPSKSASGSDHDKAVERFFSTLLATLLRQVDLDKPAKPLLLASPGFTAGSFQAYVRKEAVRTDNKKLLQWVNEKSIVAHSASGNLHALKEVLADTQVMTKLSNAKFARETALMNRFFELMRKDDMRAWYGPKEVERAVDKGAVGRGGGVLLISNALFRSQNVAERKRWVALVDRVRDVEGGEVRVLSSEHESGKRLEGLGNIAAILTFPLEDLDEEEDIDDADDPGLNVTAGQAVAV